MLADYPAMINYLRSNVLAGLALFVALGGTSYAAFNLPANSVGTKQLRSGAVTASKVRAHSLLAGNFKSGQLPRGPQGLQGVQGVQGVPGVAGTARAYALVNADGSFVSGVPHPGITAVIVAAAGTYCVTAAPNVTPAQYPAVVSADWADSPDQFPVAIYGGATCAGGGYKVVTYNNTNSGPGFAHEAFSIVIP